MDLKCELFVFVLFLFNTSLAITFTTELKNHSANNFDITSVIKLRENYKTLTKCSRPDKLSNISSLNGCYDATVHLRNNAIGMPIDFNGRVLSLEENSLEFTVDTYYKNNFTTNNHVEYQSGIWSIKTQIPNYYYPRYYTAAGGVLLTNAYYHNPSYPLNISWTPDTTMKGCLSLTYAIYHSPIVYLKIYRKENSSPMISYTLPSSGQISLKTLILRTNELFIRKTTYHIVFTLNNTGTSGYFGLKRITQCNDVEEVYKISETGSEVSYLSANIYQLDGSKTVDSALVYKECNQNKFGADCSGTCSTRETLCQGMLFCTSRFGCSCGSGYSGLFCEQKCPWGTYGLDCKKDCGENCNSCDIYTGVCIGGCNKNFILPNCTEKYPWLISPPQLVSSDYHSVKLNVSFSIENIAGSKQKTPLYYQIVYKEASSTSDFKYLVVKQIGDSNYTIDKIDNLLLGTEYTFGAVIITTDGNFNDEDISTMNYKTQCLMPKNMDYGIQLAKGAEYIYITWEKYNTKDILECEIKNYMITLIFNQEKNVHEVAYTSINKYGYDNLVPGHTYAFQITAMTIFGPIEPSDLYYETTNVHGYISIGNITANLIDSDSILYLTWELNNDDITSISYMIKYKINRHYSCSQQTVNSDWTIIVVDSKMEYSILDLIPNTQYVIKVEPITTDYTYGESENTIFVKTTTSTPSLAPVLDASQVDNQTAMIKWYVDQEKCNKLNGIVTGFHVILKNLMETTQIVSETEETAVEYTNLNPDTEYELQVYIKNDKGLNLNYVLSVPLKTEP